MPPIIQAHPTAAVVTLGVLLAVVNFGPRLVAYVRSRRATPTGWSADRAAPAGFVEYLAAIEAECTGLDPACVLTILRGGLCPKAAGVAKQVRG